MRIIAILLAGLITASACATSVQGFEFSQEDETIYLARYEAQQTRAATGGGLTSYSPLETLLGADDPKEFPSAATHSIPESVRLEAQTYASERNSTALIIWRAGKIEHESYFNGTEMHTLLNSKSLAKPLSSIAIGRAITLGHIDSLDQPVADFITEWRGDPQRKKITIRHLLGMRSGLLPQAYEQTGPNHVLNRAYLHPRHEQVIIHEYPVTHEPGSRYEYSNVNANLISPIIERATGKRYGEFLAQEVLRPLGVAGGSIWINREGGTAHSGCCTLLPARTWLSCAILLLNEGMWDGEQLLPVGFVAEMKRTVSTNPHAGLNIWIAGEYVEWRGALHPSIEIGRTFHSEPYIADDLFLFDGNGKQVVYIIPQLDLVILRTGTFPDEGFEWDNSFLPNLISRTLLKKEPEVIEVKD